jgi:hypothetical protein
MAELVAWESKDFKAAPLELFVEALPGPMEKKMFSLACQAVRSLT